MLRATRLDAADFGQRLGELLAAVRSLTPAADDAAQGKAALERVAVSAARLGQAALKLSRRLDEGGESCPRQ
jgi:hypothetical protein